MENTNKKKNKIFKWGMIALLPIIFLAAADAFTMAAPYYIRNIFPNVQEFLGIADYQLSYLMSVLGFTTLLSQLPGGWLADKVSSKKMLITALISTGVLTCVWALTPYIDEENMQLKMTVLYLVYFGWGIATTLIFWTPLWKLLSQQGKKEEQGEVYGLQGSFNGMMGFGLIYLVGMICTLALTMTFTGTPENEQVSGDIPVGFTIFAFYLAFMLFGSAFGVLLYVKEKPTKEKFSLSAKTMKEVAKNYKIWLLALFIMGIYILQTGLTFMNNYMANVLMISFIVVSFVGAFRTYLARMIISTPAGKFCDKRRSYIEVLLWALGIGMILLIIVIVIPGFNEDYVGALDQTAFAKVVIIALVITIGFLCWIMVTTRYTSIVEIETPPNSHANVVAFISFIAFSTDSWFYPIAGTVQKNHQVQITNPNSPDELMTVTDKGGSQIIFTIILGIAFFGFLCGLALFLINRWEHKNKNVPWRKELNNMEISKEEAVEVEKISDVNLNEKKVKQQKVKQQKVSANYATKLKQYNFNHFENYDYLKTKIVVHYAY